MKKTVTDNCPNLLEQKNLKKSIQYKKRNRRGGKSTRSEKHNMRKGRPFGRRPRQGKKGPQIAGEREVPRK